MKLRKSRENNPCFPSPRPVSLSLAGRTAAFDGWPSAEARIRDAPVTPFWRACGVRGRCHALLSQSGHFKEHSSPREEKSGSGVRDRASQSIYVARSPAPRRCSCPNSEGATAFAPRSLHSGPDLWDDNVPARHRQRTDPAPSPATLARFATRVPVQEMGQVSPRPERRG